MSSEAPDRPLIKLNNTDEVMPAMAAGAHPDHLFSRDGYPMLGVAILEDKKTLAMAMLDRGADPLLRYHEQVYNSPLAVAMNRLTHLEIFTRMIDDPRVLEVRGSMGDTLMHRAAAGCSPVTILEIAKRGLDVNLADLEGITPLRSAMDSGGNGGFTGYGMDIAANIRALRALGAEPIELKDSERNSNSKIIQDACQAMTEGPLLNAVRTRLPELVRMTVTRLGVNMDASDLAQARMFVGDNKPLLAWEAEMQSAIGPFAQAAVVLDNMRSVKQSSAMQFKAFGIR